MPKFPAQDTAFCVRCRRQQTIQNPKERTARNGRRMMSGHCLSCKTKIHRFLPAARR